ncbi:MAG: cation:proton antiporter [Deltaproteobacteria bacterium]|nr:cation:proton antiporter [Deltaproteobacteria bacterium]
MHAHDAVSLLVIAFGAFVIPLLSGRIGVPAAVGEILFGILVGPQVLAIMAPNDFISFLAQFGFVLLMFLVGLELEFGRIERGGVRGLAGAAGTSLLVFGFSFGIVRYLELPSYLALVFGAMSVGVVMVTLNEASMTRTRVGQTTILVGSLGEFMTIILLTGFGMYYRFGLGWHLATEMAKLGVIVVAAYAALVVLRTLIWWFPATFSRVGAARDPSEIGVRAGMATMLAFVALASLMDVEAILGSFVAGALFAFVFREKEVLQAKMSSIGFGFFVPIFFIWVGGQFNLRAVLHVDVLPMLGVFLAASLLAKVLASVTLTLQGMSIRESLAAGLLLSTPLTLLIVISRIGLEVKVIDDTTAGAVVLLALLTSVALPWLFRLLVRRSPT